MDVTLRLGDRAMDGSSLAGHKKIAIAISLSFIKGNRTIVSVISIYLIAHILV